MSAQSQAGTGQIVGTVFDATGAVVPGATVTAVNRDTQLTREVETNQAGQYRVVLLPPGPYTLTVKRTGFKTAQSEFVVHVGATVTLNATLTVGEVTEVVEVTASTLLNPTRPEATALIDVGSLANLPIIGRRFHDFITLAPTVQVEPSRSQLSIAGQRGINSNIMIDGADYNEPFFGGMRAGERAGSAFSIPQESIAEFQVVPYGYSAEFGRSSGGIVNAVTKSGGNAWHGSAFYFLRHKEMLLRDALNATSLDSLHQFGGSIGGPIRRDKSFFFFSLEDQIQDNPREVRLTRLDTVTRTAFNGEAFDFYRSIETPFTQTNDAITFLGKGDHQFTANHRLSLRYHYSKNEAVNAVATGEGLSPFTTFALSSNGTEGDRTNTLAGQFTSIFSPRLINEVRVQYSREDRPRTSNLGAAAGPGVGTTVTNDLFGTEGYPAVSTIVGTFGTRSFFPTTAFTWRLQIADNLTWNVGRHSFKFGGDFNHLFISQSFGFNQMGVFGNFPGSDVNTHLSLLSKVATDPDDHRFNNSSITYDANVGNGQLDFSGREIAAFFTDTWRLTPRFTVTYGLRWEAYFNPTPATTNTTLYDLVRTTTFPLGSTDPAIIPDNRNQFMPRVGIAWDPWGNAKTVLRASAGIYYARTPFLLYAAPMNNFRTPAGDLSVRLPLARPTGFVCTPIATGDTCNTVYWQMRRIGIDLDTIPLNNFNLPPLTLTQIQNIATALGLAVDLNRGLRPLTTANNYEAPRSWQWTVGVEHEVLRGWLIGGDFAYVNTVHLERNRDWNLPLPIVCPGDVSLRPNFLLISGGACPTPTFTRPIASLSSVTVRESASRSFYRGFTFKSVFRRARYNFGVYYTLSKNTSYDDNERDATGFRYDNSYDLTSEYSFSSIDVTHLFSFWSLFELPAGFTVGVSGRASSARPFDPQAGTDFNEDDNRFQDRPYRAAGVSFKRNSFRDRPVRRVDARVGKNFKLPWEGKRLEFLVDFINVFNFDNVTFGGFNQNWNNRGISPTTGAILAPDLRFRRLRNPANCLSVDPLRGNPSCYDTRNNSGRPFTVQAGLRFTF